MHAVVGAHAGYDDDLDSTTTSCAFKISDINNSNEKSARRRRKHCALAVVRRSQRFSPRHRPPSQGRGTAKI